MSSILISERNSNSSSNNSRRTHRQEEEPTATPHTQRPVHVRSMSPMLRGVCCLAFACPCFRVHVTVSPVSVSLQHRLASPCLGSALTFHADLELLGCALHGRHGGDCILHILKGEASLIHIEGLIVQRVALFVIPAQRQRHTSRETQVSSLALLQRHRVT